MRLNQLSTAFLMLLLVTGTRVEAEIKKCGLYDRDCSDRALNRARSFDFAIRITRSQGQNQTTCTISKERLQFMIDSGITIFYPAVGSASMQTSIHSRNSLVARMNKQSVEIIERECKKVNMPPFKFNVLTTYSPPAGSFYSILRDSCMQEWGNNWKKVDTCIREQNEAVAEQSY